MKKILLGLVLLLSSNVNAESYRITTTFQNSGELEAKVQVIQDFEKEKAVSFKSFKVNDKDFIRIENYCEDNDKEKKCEKKYVGREEGVYGSIEYIKDSKQFKFTFKYKVFLGKIKNLENYDIYEVNKIVDEKEQEIMISELKDYKIKLKIQKNKNQIEENFWDKTKI